MCVDNLESIYITLVISGQSRAVAVFSFLQHSPLIAWENSQEKDWEVSGQSESGAT